LCSTGAHSSASDLTIRPRVVLAAAAQQRAEQQYRRTRECATCLSSLFPALGVQMRGRIPTMAFVTAGCLVAALCPLMLALC
jgi:hypothetical protein